MGNASRTIIATIKTTSSTASNRQYICGYGNWGQNYEIFSILIRNETDYGGNNSDEYALGLGGWYNDFYSSFKITANVETTIAVSYNLQNKTVHFFKKEENVTVNVTDNSSSHR